MTPIESEIYRTATGEFVESLAAPELKGEYPYPSGATFTIERIIDGKRNGKRAIKAVVASVSPPYSDGRTQRFPLNGRPSESVPPEAENTLAGGQFKTRLRLTK